MININKIYDDFSKENTSGNCLLCGKNGKFCKSHSVPRNRLKNSEDGKIYSVSKFGIEDFGFFKEESTHNGTGIFKNICPECDKKKFKKYEIPNPNYADNDVLQQVALKSLLYRKYHTDFKLYFYKAIRYQDELLQLDLKQLELEIKQFSQKRYNLLYDLTLNIDEEIYTNSCIVPLLDANENLMNELYNNHMSIEKHLFFYIYNEDKKLRIIIFSEVKTAFKLKKSLVPEAKLDKVLKYILLYHPYVFFGENTIEKFHVKRLQKLYDLYNVGDDVNPFTNEPFEDNKKIYLEAVKKSQRIKIWR
ncbi:MAG: hypothetical protein ACRCUP_04535 [Mycoplasmatales bacterium]